MIIKVTKKNIKDGVKGAYYNCPVALAIQKALRNKDVSVCEGYVDIMGDWYWLPKNAVKWIQAFDDRKPIKPFSFKLGLNVWGEEY